MSGSDQTLLIICVAFFSLLCLLGLIAQIQRMANDAAIARQTNQLRINEMADDLKSQIRMVQVDSERSRAFAEEIRRAVSYISQPIRARLPIIVSDEIGAYIQKSVPPTGPESEKLPTSSIVSLVSKEENGYEQENTDILRRGALKIDGEYDVEIRCGKRDSFGTLEVSTPSPLEIYLVSQENVHEEISLTKGGDRNQFQGYTSKLPVGNYSLVVLKPKQGKEP